MVGLPLILRCSTLPSPANSNCPNVFPCWVLRVLIPYILPRSFLNIYLKLNVISFIVKAAYVGERIECIVSFP